MAVWHIRWADPAAALVIVPLSGFEQLAETTREKNIVVWLNEYFGPISRDGERFDEMMECKQHQDKLSRSRAEQRTPLVGKG